MVDLIKHFSNPYHAHYEQVKTYINNIEINGLNALIQVDGGIYVDFQYGNDEDHLISETFPFEGEMSLNLLKQEIKNAKLNIDDSHWS
ncbi:hypothetical protein PN36_16570 [Candidatus Thiomargarita nelsonii]|uniref:Predicted pPIWI-associating nuclease group 2 domain-containing protein n=1 Tax=Candidatus Thiomargarita nelsonii TaxID=1003181 RepID=A0A0A6PDC8_9GAMM|nr:hypothetical protein PN36_16570 [Candidatus Thiomargarita nelsonii]